MSARVPVAIVGMAGVMPGCVDLAGFWQALLDGTDLVGNVPDNRWRWQEYVGESSEERNVTSSSRGGFIPHVDGFDPALFGISPREAETLDPQQRLLLCAAWEAFENAAISPSQLAGSRCGVFIGASGSDFKGNIEQPDRVRALHQASGTHQSMLANRISFQFDLRGPSETIDTACSSSLVAIHRALAALASGEIDMALAGGIHLMLSPEMTVQYSKAGMLSPDGRCHTFDHRANGYVRSEGLGLVVLKPLALAQLAGDPIHAVIVGSAENHGGRANSLTAPNPKAQTALIVESTRSASLSPDAIGLVEAHGTGTALGDPIEVNALKAAFNELGVKRAERPWCALGAVKTCVGHLEAAAGMAGLFKAVFSIQHGLIPGNLNYEKTNPHIDLAGSPFALATHSTPWAPEDPTARFATVSSFGFGGVNAHLVIGPPPSIVEPADESPRPRVFVLSAPDTRRLAMQARCLLEHPALSAHRPLPDGSGLMEHLIELASERLGRRLGGEDAHMTYAELGVQMTDVRALCEAFHAPAEEIGKFVAQTASLAQLAEALAASVAIDLPEKVPLLIRKLPMAPAAASQWRLDGLAATLCLGRQVFDERAIVVAGSPAELAAGLAAVAGSISGADNCWQNNPRNGRIDMDRQFADPMRQRCYQDGLRWLNERRPKVDWHAHFAQMPQRLALPGLAFRLQSYPLGHTDGHLRAPAAAQDWQALLLGENRSDVRGFRFSRKVVAGDQVWSGATPGGYLAHGLRLFEALAGGLFQVGGKIGASVDGMAWSPPHALAAGDEIRLQLASTGGQWIAETSALQPNGTERLLCQAEIAFETSDPAPANPPDRSWRELTVAPASQRWAEAVSRALETELSPPVAQWVPFRLQAGRIDAGMEAPVHRLFVRISQDTPQTTRVDLLALDSEGRPHTRLDGLELRASGAVSPSPRAPSPGADAIVLTHLARPAWKAQTPAKRRAPETLLVLDSTGEGGLAAHLAALLVGTRVRRLTAAPGEASSTPEGGVLRLNHSGDWTRLLEHELQQHQVDRISVILPAKALLPGEGSMAQVLQMQATLLALGQCGLHRLGLRAIDLLIPLERDGGTAEDDPSPAIYALAAWGRTLKLEDDPLALRVVDLGTSRLESTAGIQRIRAELEIENDSLAVWTDGGRRTPTLDLDTPNTSTDRLNAARGGAVLVSGGMGRLAVLVAEHLAHRYRMTVHLCGRRAPAPELVEQWRSRDLSIEYHAVDVTDADALKALVKVLDEPDGGLAGVVHCAGVVRDKMAARKRHDDLHEVLLPKMAGALALDAATADSRLHFFALFGSIVGRFGNAGQVDYAYANAWLAGFAQRRHRMAEAGRRSGHTVCIDWPYWADGGMHLSDEQITAFQDRHGVLPLSNEAGIAALERAVNGDAPHLVVLHGFEDDFSRHLASTATTVSRESSTTEART